MNEDQKKELADARKIVKGYEEAAIAKANVIIKEVWPNENLQVCLNLSKDRSNANFNTKQSGILSNKVKS